MGKSLSLTEFVALIAFLFSLIAIGTDMMLPALGIIAVDLKLQTENHAQLIITVFLLGTGLGQLISGPISDTYGRKIVLCTGISLFILASIAAIITSDFLIPTIAYSFTYNNQQDFRDNNFSFFKIRIANSGNIGGLLSNKKDNNNRKTIFNIPLAQYFKTDIEYKKFWEIDDSSVIGFRSFIGAIIPYDNSAIPFTKSYFAGGSNDIRAWQTYDLGPGSRNSGLEYNIGSLKFLTSAEYRFDLFGSLKGALFVDAGNIWDITNSIFAEEEARFNGLNSVKDIAVGSGFGLRYDFSFLVFRLDLGFKMHEPYLESNKWFRNYNFSNAVYNIGINYPF